ncbi:MAG: asparaginase, partial [Burkholderiaceae bacterium]|nr:asparaginase [Burkholderiaceae bacterium]
MGTGGTIAGTSAQAGDNIGYTAAQVGVAQLLQAVPGLHAVASALHTEQVAQIDSKDMDGEVWRALALRSAHHLADPEVRGIVITHGTDTLEETAWFLHQVLDARKPVVLTCAMRPATALAPDGPQNLLDAVAVALTPGATGVLMVASG